MAQIDDNRPKAEKTSASVTSTLPKLCPTTKIEYRDISCNIPKPKSQSLGNRLVSNENKNYSGFVKHLKTNLHKSKLTEIKNSDKTFSRNVSLIFLSPKNYHGQIPVYHRHTLNFLRMSSPVTRAPSPLKKNSLKETKQTNKMKTITMDRTAKKKTQADSRSPSPLKRNITPSYKKSKLSGVSPKKSDKAGTVKRSEATKQGLTPRKSERAKSKMNVSCFSYAEYESKRGAGKEPLTLTNGPPDGAILKQSSQPSLCQSEKLLPPQDKVSLDHLKQNSGSHRGHSFEKVRLRIEKSVEEPSLGERKESYFVTYSKEDIKNQEDISLAFLQNLSSSSITTFSRENDNRVPAQGSDSKSAIRTLSGHELILTPSMKLAMEKTDIESEDIEISELLHETGENFEEQKKDVHIFQDDANEYDSEMSTDGETSKTEQTRHLPTVRAAGSKVSDIHRKSSSSLWKSREADLLNDVDYRQSLYHPAVSRRQIDESDMEFKPKSKSIEDNYGFAKKMTTERIIRSRSSNLRSKYSTHNFSTCRTGIGERSWGASFDKTDDKQIYNPVLQDIPLYGPFRGVKRIKTKKEKVSVAFLRFTLKVIRLLALFNVWPGDNCHMLTAQSLSSAR